jgi:hypothetical protein
VDKPRLDLESLYRLSTSGDDLEIPLEHGELNQQIQSINAAIPSFVIWNSLEIPKIPKIPKSVQGKIIVDMFYS